MGTKNVRFSDLSGRLLDEDQEPLRLVVLEHPELEQSVQLEALPHEVAPALDAALSVAIFEIHQPDGARRVVVVDFGDFDALATDRPMRELLKAAQPASKAVRPAVKNGGPSINYATPEYAGIPHRGRVTAEEARIVREHLEEVNARLAREGLRRIDPANPADAARYGFAVPGGDGPSEP